MPPNTEPRPGKLAATVLLLPATGLPIKAKVFTGKPKIGPEVPKPKPKLPRLPPINGDETKGAVPVGRKTAAFGNKLTPGPCGARMIAGALCSTPLMTNPVFGR